MPNHPRATTSWLLIFSTILIWSAINPFDRLTWMLEVFPAIIAIIILAATYKKFPLTPLTYWLILIHAIILMIGGHYTYAKVPLFDSLRDAFDLSRNHYDRLGHLAQGFIPAIIAREILLRRSPLNHGKWLFFIVTCICLAISAFYEFIEWWVAIAVGGDAESFLALQGDIWDTQSDMFLAMIGAILALLTLRRLHDHQLARLQKNAGKGR